MDENLDIDKLLKTCIVLLEYSREKTLSARTIQSAFRIVYVNDNENLKKGIMTGTKYVTEYVSNENTKINTFNHYKNVLRNFLQNDARELTTNEYRLGSNSIPYFCGIADTLNNQIQQFN